MSKAQLLTAAPDLLFELALNKVVDHMEEPGLCRLCPTPTPNLAVTFCKPCQTKILLATAAQLDE